MPYHGLLNYTLLKSLPGSSFLIIPPRVQLSTLLTFCITPHSASIESHLENPSWCTQAIALIGPSALTPNNLHFYQVLHSHTLLLLLSLRHPYHFSTLSHTLINHQHHVHSRIKNLATPCCGHSRSKMQVLHFY